MNSEQKTQRGQILIITLLVLTILSILTVSLVILNNRDVGQTVNNEIYEKIYNSSETKLKEVVGILTSSTQSLSILTTRYGSSCVNLGGSIATYECNFTLTSDSDNTITYSDKVTVSNEKDIVNYGLNKDRPLTINLDGYSNAVRVGLNKAIAMEFTLIYLQGGTYRTISGVYDPSTGTYNSIDPTFNTYISLISGNPLNFNLQFPASYSAFKLLTITPRSKAVGDAVLLSVTGTDLATYPVQVRRFNSQAYMNNNADSPSVKIVSQFPLTPQLEGMLDYALITPDTVDVSN